MGRYRAVIFDLYGPLIPNLAADFQTRSLGAMATTVGIDPERFARLWGDARVAVDDASPATAIEKCLRHVCAAAGVRPDDVQLRALAESRWAALREAHRPRASAAEVLKILRGRGLLVGLITDCGVEVPHLWRRSELARYVDRAVFSCSLGCRKPDPRVYHAACEGLHLEPSQCLYVADGENGELAGARAVGMDAMLFCPADERELVMKREEPRAWTGPYGRTLNSVLWATEATPTLTWHVPEATPAEAVHGLALVGA